MMPTADVSVRPARLDDVPALAALQADVWRERYASLLPAPVLAGLTPEALAAEWEEAIRTAPSRRHQALVALEGPRVVGLVSLAPAADPDLDPRTDTEVNELLVAPSARRRGHGSRLLQAVADTVRPAVAADLAPDRDALLVTWLLNTEADAGRFLAIAGWAVDGATRTLALDGGEAEASGDGQQVSQHVSQQRWHTALG